MTALGLVMETVLRLVGPLFFPFFLLFCKYSDNLSISRALCFVADPLVFFNGVQGSSGTYRPPSWTSLRWTISTVMDLLSQYVSLSPCYYGTVVYCRTTGLRICECIAPSQVWNSVDTGKAIIYGTKNHLTQNFIVNLGWVIGGTIALLSVAAYKRKQQDKQEYEERVEKVENERQEKREQRQAQEDGAHERQASDEDTAAGSDDSSDATRRV